MVDAKRIQEILFDCFLNDEDLDRSGENTIPKVNCIVQKGLVRTFVFNPDKINTYEQEIKENLDQIQDLDQGISFLSFGICKDAKDKSGYNGWGEHMNFEQLTSLGEAAGWLTRPFPAELQAVLPGGVPYFQLLKERREMNIVTPEEFIEKY